MSVKTALQLINAELDRIQENFDIEMDLDNLFCIHGLILMGLIKDLMVSWKH